MHLPAAFPVLLVVPAAFAQQDASSRLRPITAPIRHAGVFHVATGTWTRGPSLANAAGPDVIYDNTCAPVYFAAMVTDERYEHRSRIPSTSGPTTGSIHYGTSQSGHRFDERPGCLDEYLVDGFQVGYCSSHAGPVDWRYGFASSHQPVGGALCGTADIVPDYTITVTGLPGASSGSFACWTVDVDLSGLPGGGMLLSADGDGVFAGPSTANQFGWSLGPASTVLPSDLTGPIIAGNLTWTGGPGTVSGLLAPCTGTDGTIWDAPPNPGEPGTGMASNDYFRATGTSCGSPLCGPNCISCCIYWGGNPHADFHLRLFAETGCPPADPMTGFCFPDVGGVRSCPCGNPQVPAGSAKGCDNFGPDPAGGSGGATLASIGAPRASNACALVFLVDGTVITAGGNLNVLWMGGSTLAAGVKNGLGVRCVGGPLRRIYSGSNPPGTGSKQFPNEDSPPQSTNAWVASQMPAAGTTLHYYDAYRNAGGPGDCFTVSDRFNLTNAGSITWVP